MAKPNISDSQKNIHNLKENKILLLYNKDIDAIPVGVVHEKIDNIENINFHLFNHIVLLDLLDQYDDKEIVEFLTSLHNKILDETIIEVQSADIKQLCVSAANDDIDIQLVKDIIYSRKTIHNIYDIENYLIDAGFNIYIKRYINIFEYNIVGKK